MNKLILLSTLIFFISQFSHAQPGMPDPAFGNNGITKTEIGSPYNYILNGQQVLSQADGSIFIIFEANGLATVSKKHADGSPDVTYGNKGFSVSVPLLYYASAILQPDGKMVIAGPASNVESYFNSSDFAVARLNADGSLDNTFGKNGIQVTDVGDSEEPTALTLQPDGKIVLIGGVGFYDEPSRLVIARYNANGTLDNTFDSDGLVFASINGDVGISVAIQSDGKIVVGGYSSISRYNVDGSPDVSFNKTGIQYLGNHYIGNAIAVQSNGKIVLCGYIDSSRNDVQIQDFLLMRINTNGTYDSTFDGDGKVITDFGGPYDKATALFIEANGKIIVGGTIQSVSYGPKNIAVAHYNANGSLDLTYSGDGKQVINADPANSFSFLNKQPDGKLLVLSNTPNSITLQLVRYNVDGAPDNTFDGDGILIDHMNEAYTVYTSTAVQRDGKVVAAGYAWNGNNYDFAVARYNTNGTLDAGFSGDGKVMTDFASSVDLANDIAIQSDGKIVVAGSAGSKFALVRYNTDGSLDNTFDSDGKVTTDLMYNASSLVIQADGNILVGGSGLARYTTNGALDAGFDGDGKVVTPFNCNDIALQSDGKIVAVGGSTAARFNIDGSPDLTFGDIGDGTQDYFQNNPEPYIFNSIAIQNDGKMIFGGYYAEEEKANEFSFFLILRANANGTPDVSFAENGSLSISPNQYNYDFATSVAIQDNNKIILAGYAYNGSSNDFAIIRLNPDGSLDNTFSNNGILIAPVSAANDKIEHITITNNKLYAAGEGEYPGYSGIVSRYLLDNESQLSPNVSLTAPANNATYLAPATFTLTAAASIAGSNITSVQFYNNQTLLFTDNTSPYSYTMNDVPIGNYLFIAKAIAANGSTNNSATAAVLVSPAPNKAPLVTITSPVNNAAYVTPASITINASASDPDGTITSVKFYNGATLLSTDNTSPYTYTINNAAAVNYKIFAIAMDNNGLTGSSATVSVVGVPASSNKTPLVSITSPANNAKYSAGTSITLNAAASDGDGTVTGVQFYNGTALLATDNTSPYSYTLKNAATGIYSFVAKVIDNSGLTNNSATVSVGVSSTSANKAPAVNLTAPANNATYVTNSSITLSASASDPDGSIASVKLYNGATLLATDNTSPYTFTISNATTGSYKFYAKATDNNGLANSSSTVSVFVVPGAVNKTPVVNITNPLNNAIFAEPATITLHATAVDEDGSIGSVQFYSNGALINTVTESPYNFTLSNLAYGNYSFVAKAIDNNGLTNNSATVQVAVSYVSKSPGISLNNPLNNATFTAPANITLNATASDANGTITNVKFYNGSTLLKTSTSPPYSYTFANAAAGNYKFYARATDNDGLTNSTPTATVEVAASNNNRISEAATKVSILNSSAFTQDSKTGRNNIPGIALSPNPARNILKISINGLALNKPLTISVISASGVVLKTIRSNSFDQIKQLNVSFLISGMYMLKITSGDQVIYRQFVKL